MNQDLDLLKRARRLEEDALAEIYDLYSDEIYRYAMRLLGDVQLAEDCVMETFSRLLKAFHGGGGPDTYLRAYLYRVAHNWITDLYRRGIPDGENLARAINLSAEGDPSEAIQTSIEHQLVRDSLKALTPDQRMVITLRYLEGWQNEEIAEALGKQVGAVKALQHRALASLQRLLIKEGNLS